MPNIATMDTTTITVSVENYQWLNSLKRPGDSFNDVLDRLRDADRPTSPHRLTPDADQLPDDLGLPGSGETLNHRRSTIAHMYQYLQDQGTATKSEFLELVDADQVGYSSPESFWANCIKGRDTLRSLPGVEAPGEGMREWRYTD